MMYGVIGDVVEAYSLREAILVADRREDAR